MSKTHYELLEIVPDAPADEIKRAFRREIAKYHPDKVQHLGKEFQEIAAIKAAELTQAYKTLTDPVLRAEYDALVAEGVDDPAAAATHARPQAPPPTQEQERPNEKERPAEKTSPSAPPPPRDVPSGGQFVQEREGVSEFIRRAAVARFRGALLGEFGTFEEITLAGFEVTCVPKPAFWSFKIPPRVLGRIVPFVDGPVLAETWAMASRIKKDGQRDLCVFLMGPALAPAGELAAAITEQRKKPMPPGGKLTMVPVNITNWDAKIPNDAPPVVKALVEKLKAR